MKEKTTVISKPFYSNCYIEAFRQKIMNPNIKLIFIPGYKGKTPHCMWTDGNDEYDFGYVDPDNPSKHVLLYRGAIRKFRCGFATKWKGYIISKIEKL